MTPVLTQTLPHGHSRISVLECTNWCFVPTLMK